MAYVGLACVLWLCPLDLDPLNAYTPNFEALLTTFQRLFDVWLLLKQLWGEKSAVGK